MKLHGVVSSGLGRAHVFMAQTHYQEQFKQVLGVGAWPGTLNVDMAGESLASYRDLRILAGLDEGEITSGPIAHRIKGFEREGRSFGGATAFKGEISADGEEWIICAILIPDLTRHTETAEIISGSFLREALPCKDGEKLTIRLR